MTSTSEAHIKQCGEELTAGSDSRDVSDCDSRRPPRTATSQTLHAILIPVDGNGGSIRGEVVDLAKGGVKLVVAEDVALGEQISIQLLEQDEQVALDISGTVCWSRPLSNGHWRVGCRFDVELPIESIGNLAMSGHLERRRYTRFPMALKAAAQCQLDRQPLLVELEDVSEGGFCMYGAQMGEVGQSVRLILDDGRDEGTVVADKVVVATVRWQVKAGSGYLVGCEFADSQGYAQIKELSDGVDAEPGPQASDAMPAQTHGSTGHPSLPGEDPNARPSASIRQAYRRLLVACLGIGVAFWALWVSAGSSPDYLLRGLAVAVAAVSSWQFLAATKATPTDRYNRD